MHKNLARRPIGNFFVLKDLQMRLIGKIMLIILLTTAVCLVSLLSVYMSRYRSVLFYQLNMDGELVKENILNIILPSLIISGLVSISLGAILGLYASRKYAVPIYKLEQWARLLRKGKFTAYLRFREGDELKQLSSDCNLLADTIRSRLLAIQTHVNEFRKDGSPEAIDAIGRLLAEYELESDSIDVHTAFFTLPPELERPAG
jgi:methyl-accepting chemotaxis protein